MGVQNFTPGPWGFESFALSEEIKSLNNPLIATVQSRHCESPEEMRANAQLIAASPDMYAILGRALDALQRADDYGVPGLCALIEDAYDVLAKARGE